ncbi:hypothetical protein BGZ92_004889, partial [Podila epicladia]
MQAAGQGQDRIAYLVTENKNNTFLNKSIEQCIADIESGKFTVPGTNLVINTGKGGNTERTTPRSAFSPGDPKYRVQHTFVLKENGEPIVIINVIGDGETEPAHVGVTYSSVRDGNGKCDCLKFPLVDPHINEKWQSKLKTKWYRECKQVPTDITKQSPDGTLRDLNGSGGGGSGSKGGGEGSGGNNSESGGSGRRNGGNPRSDGSGGRSPGSAPRKSGAGCGSMAAFQHNLNQKKLVDSYNSTNPKHPLIKNGHQQQIGGVAISNPNAILLNLNSSLYDLTADG